MMSPDPSPILPKDALSEDLEAMPGVPSAMDGDLDLAQDGPLDVPRPIGPARLRALREAIENGSYPTPEDVRGGLERLFSGSRAEDGNQG